MHSVERREEENKKGKRLIEHIKLGLGRDITLGQGVAKRLIGNAFTLSPHPFSAGFSFILGGGASSPITKIHPNMRQAPRQASVLAGQDFVLVCCQAAF